MPFILTAIAFPLLLFMQRWVHTHLHGLALLLMGTQERAAIVYALVLLPGVFLHEASHWVMAKLMGVRTAAFSLIPRRKADGSIQLGYVAYYKTAALGPIRESLIGGAPLIAGTAVTLLIGFKIFDLSGVLTAVQSGDIAALTAALRQILQVDDFFVWLYLVFAVSNGMMPSASDRRAWPAFLAMMGGAAFFLFLLDMQAVLWRGLAVPTAVIFGYLGLVLGMAVAVDLTAMLLLLILESIVSKIKGVNVVYN